MKTKAERQMDGSLDVSSFYTWLTRRMRRWEN